jgi:hypothetical protein
VVVIVINMFGQVWLNRWNGAFFDAIELRDTGEIGRQLVRFIYIVGIMLVLVVAQTWLHETTKLRVREWLTQHLFDAWLVGGRPYLLGASGNTGALAAAATALAAQQRPSLTRLIEEGLQLRLRAKADAASLGRVRLPVFKGRGGLAKGVNPLSNKALLEALDDDA